MPRIWALDEELCLNERIELFSRSSLQYLILALKYVGSLIGIMPRCGRNKIMVNEITVQIGVLILFQKSCLN